MNYELITIDGVKKIKRTEEVDPIKTKEEALLKAKELESTIKGWNDVISQNQISKKKCEDELALLSSLIKKM